MRATDCLRAKIKHILFWQENAQTNYVLQLAGNGREGCEGGYSPYLRHLKQCPDTSDTVLHE
jgi:hypothetical protein